MKPPEKNSSVPDNPFDPDRLRLSQNFGERVGVKKLLTTVPVRKPDSQEFVRVHPYSESRLDTAVLFLKDERETFLVDPALWSDLPGQLVPKTLFTTITRQGTLLLWPIRLPGEDGRLDSSESLGLGCRPARDGVGGSGSHPI